MKYDDAEYCFLNFETDRLPNEAGGTHMGMYLAWAASKGLLDWDFDEQTLAPLLAREVTGSQLFFDRCDGKLTDDDLNDVGNAFTASYYDAHFVADYQRVFADQIPNGGETTDDFCSVPDTWENYDRLAPVLDQRFAQWRQAQTSAPRPVASPATAPPTPRPAPVAPAPSAAPPMAADDGGDADVGRVGGAAVIALLVGAAGFILLLLAASFAQGAALQALAVLVGAVAAFGAWRCSLGLGKSGGASALLAVLAFVPALGSFVCLWLVLQIYRQRDAG
ncbi:MAG: hypothetical protein NT046_04335 [Arenimonas sp.]|nr:hypothetical protein [Arenimonas sp.]